MSNSGKKNSLGADEKDAAKKVTRKDGKTGKTAKQIMSRHISDKNDIITEEEFKDLNVGLDASKDTEHEPIILPKGDKRPKDEDKDPEMLTPWDLIK